MSDDHVLDAALQMIDGRDAEIAALRAQVAELREALKPFAIVLGSLDDKLDWPHSGMHVSSKLFPLWADGDDKVSVYVPAKDGQSSSTVDIDEPPPERLHEVEYYLCESIYFDKDCGGKLHDNFELLGVHQNGTACYIGRGSITMAEVRHARAALEMSGGVK